VTKTESRVTVLSLDVYMGQADLLVTQVVWKATTQLGCGEFTCGVSLCLDQSMYPANTYRALGLHSVSHSYSSSNHRNLADALRRVLASRQHDGRLWG
jgi:hypothetical protein